MGLFSCLFFPLLAGTLQLHTLTSGVKVWTQENSEPPQMISLRIVEDDKKYALDVFGESAQEIDRFFCYVHQNATSPYQVIAVGDFDERNFVTWIESRMKGLSPFLTEKKPSNIVYSIQERTTISLFYPMVVQPICNQEAFKRFWSAALFRKLVEKRLKASLESSAGQWDNSKEAFFFPQKTCGGAAHCSPAESLAVLAKFLTAIQEIKKEGFSAAEWKDAQLEMIGRLKIGLRVPPDSSVLATYFSEHIASGITSWPLSYPFFVSSSIQTIKELPRSSIYEIANIVIQDKERKVRYSGPDKIDEDKVQMVLNEFSSDEFILPVLEDQEVGIDEKASAPFNQMPVTEEEEKLIWELIDNLGNKGWGGLLLAQLRMFEIKKKIQHIHPLRFLGAIFADPYLKKCMKKAFMKDLVKSRFLNELGDNFLKEFPSNNVYPLVPGFCKKVGADSDEVSAFIRSSRWEHLLEYLIDL